MVPDYEEALLELSGISDLELLQEIYPNSTDRMLMRISRYQACCLRPKIFVLPEGDLRINEDRPAREVL